MMNHRGSAASMETEGSQELFRRSVERNVRYDCKLQYIAFMLAIFLANPHKRHLIALL